MTTLQPANLLRTVHMLATLQSRVEAEWQVKARQERVRRAKVRSKTETS